MKRGFLRSGAGLLLALLLQPAIARAQGGTWTTLTAPVRIQDGMLMMDGSILAEEYASQTGNWWRLTPDASGNFLNGTWTLDSHMPIIGGIQYAPLYYCSAVLPDGRLVIIGGEYNYQLSNGAFTYVTVETTKGAIYDPTTHTWANLPPPTGVSRIGDSMCSVLAIGPRAGQLALGPNSGSNMYALNPTTLTWTALAPTGKTGSDSEEGWTLLPDGTFLDVLANTTSGTVNLTQRYFPNLNQWRSATVSPVPLRDSSSHETGAQVMMYNGKVFAAGADRNTGSNAVYTPPANQDPPSTDMGSWIAAPPFPRKPYATAPPSTNCTGTAPNLMCQLDQADGPGAALPNGKVLVIAAPGVFNPDSYAFEYDFTNNTLTEVARPANAANKRQYQYHMVLLPTGQVFTSDDSAGVQIYTPDGAPDPAWAPAITSVPHSLKAGHTYSLSGTQLNGLTEGTYYGDDYSSATNYPIVRITNHASGHVFWGRTHDRDNLKIATDGVTITTAFDAPANLEVGTSDLVVIVNGIPSAPVEINHPPVTTASVAGTAGLNGWYVSNVLVTLTASDPDGDLSATKYTVDGGPAQDYSGPFAVSGDLEHAITFWSEDQSGNVENAGSQTIKVDTTPPTLTFGSQSPAANGFGWNSTAVDIPYTTGDNLSGVASALPAAVHFGSEGAGQTVTVIVVDDAGNTAAFTTPAVNIDVTAPTLTITPALGSLWPPDHKLVTDPVSGIVADPIAGIDPDSLTFTVVDEYGAVQPSGAIAVHSDGSFGFGAVLQADRLGTDLDGRVYRIIVSGRDRAGNAVTASAIVIVPHDQR